MVTILLIADQERLARLFSFAGESPQISFRLSHSLQQGLQEIAAAPPGFLFVQNHLSGLSGEIIARHLLAQSEGTLPTVVLFGEAAPAALPPDPIHCILDVTATDEALTAAIIEIIFRHVPTEVEHPTPATDAGALAPEAAVAEAPILVPSSPAEDSTAISAAALLQAAIPGGHDEASPALSALQDAPGTEPTTETTFDRQLQHMIDQTPSPVPLAEIEAIVPGPASSQEPFTHRSDAEQQRPAPVRLPMGIPWLALVVAVVVVVAATVFLSSRPSPKPVSTPPQTIKAQPPASPASSSSSTRATSAPTASSPATETPAPATTPVAPAPGKEPTQAAAPKHVSPPAAVPSPKPPSGRGLKDLPDFIPRTGSDKAYGTRHPGWELYRGARTEFKVYREHGTIMAIQAIDRSGVGIPEAFMKGALNQVAHTRDYRVAESASKGSFLVEKGTAADTRIVVYRTIPGKAVKAFVVYFQ